MTILPIAERELRVAARRRATYWRRFGAGAVALALGMWVMAVESSSPANSLGAMLFATLSVMVFVGLPIAGVQTTADSLSEEKREGTLGLLFLTDLKGYDVVFGKLAATSVALFYDLMAIVPILAISMLLGGVGVGEFWRVVLTAFNLLILSVSLGMFCSAVSKNGVHAASRAFALLALLVFAGPLLGAAMSSSRGTFEFLFLTTPAAGCFLAFDSQYSGSSPQFWTSAVITVGYSVFFLWMACRAVPRVWQDRSVKLKTSAVELPLSARHNPKVSDLNPYFWRAVHSGNSWQMWVGLGMILGFWVWQQWLITDAGGFVFEPNTALITMALMHLLLKAVIAAEASRCFCEDRRDRAMELLLSTPLTCENIIKGQCQALLHRFFVPVSVVLAMDLIFAIFSSRAFYREEGLATVYITTIVFFLADIYALAWTGMWLGLKSQTPNKAMRGAFMRIVVGPALIAGAVIALISSGARGDSSGQIYVVWWLAGIAADIAFGIGAATNLRERFREVVCGT